MAWHLLGRMFSKAQHSGLNFQLNGNSYFNSIWPEVNTTSWNEYQKMCMRKGVNHNDEAQQMQRLITSNDHRGICHEISLRFFFLFFKSLGQRSHHALLKNTSRIIKIYWICSNMYMDYKTVHPVNVTDIFTVYAVTQPQVRNIHQVYNSHLHQYH